MGRRARPAHQARQLHHDTLTRRRRVLGDDHPSTLRCAHNLAADLHALGDYQQARDLNEDTLTRCRHILGENHPSTMLTTANLVSTLRAQGQHHQGPTPRTPNQTNICCPAPSPWQR